MHNLSALQNICSQLYERSIVDKHIIRVQHNIRIVLYIDKLRVKNVISYISLFLTVSIAEGKMIIGSCLIRQKLRKE